MDAFLIAPRPASLDGLPQSWLVFFQGRLLLPRDGFPALPDSRFHAWLSPSPLVEHYVGQLGERHCLAVELPDDAELPEGFELLELRQLLGILDAQQFALVSRAAQVVAWFRNHRYCSRCGTSTVPHLRDFAMVCPQCDYAQYPRITPCVIMLVRRGEQALLARSARFRTPMYSCLAGFMEAGETAEQAVCREVLEETGLRVHNLRYHGSQSWPFPHSLMLAFMAEYLDGEIRLDDDEIVDADWYTPQTLPMVPPHGSIARTLIEAWLADTGHEKGSAS